MNAAATQDVREMSFEPVLSKVLHAGRAPNSRDAKMVALLDLWRRQGGSRLDRTGDGQITAPGAAILDAAWPLLAKAWASSVLGATVTRQLSSFVTPYEAPPGGQETSWIPWMDKDLRTLLGEHVNGRFATRYCGGCSLKRCQRLLWAAIDKAGRELTARQGPNPAGWHSSATKEEITFIPGLLTYRMRYTNRSTGIQQVISFSGHAPGEG